MQSVFTQPIQFARSVALRSRVAWACFLLTAVAGIGLDQFTKVVAFRRLADVVYWSEGRVIVRQKSVYPFIPGWLHFEVTANQGAVFGLGQGQRTLFIVVSAAAIGFIFYLFVVSDRQRFYQVVLGMLLAGVIGNLYDRATLGYVRDMIHALPRWSKLFPYIFNVADSLLCVGVALMILYSFFYPVEKRA